ncbi:MAG: hypothetical protein AB7I59_09065 [Geminicoccaceae bacterium]
MSDAIFLLREGKLVELTDRPYDSEALLQSLLAEYPDLIAGKQIDTASPRRWLLVSREMAVPSEPGAGSRWSLDHLFLDQDGIPTLVEVKRSTDSRIRREVVGQMLDYAANAVVYWPVEEVRARFEARCVTASLDPAAELSMLLAGQDEVDTFWSKVKTNLQAGRIRLMFVADVIPTELRRVVEFLNAQMDPAEVLALEIKQYVGEGLKTLVPRIVGQTAEAETRKGRSGGQKWDEQSFFVEFEKLNDSAVTGVARTIFDWARTKGQVWFGSGTQSGSFGLTIPIANSKRYLFAVYTYGTIEIYFQWLKNLTPLDPLKRQEFLDRLNSVPGINLRADIISKRPAIRLAALGQPGSLSRFIQTLEWAVAEICAGGETQA